MPATMAVLLFLVQFWLQKKRMQNVHVYLRRWMGGFDPADDDTAIDTHVSATIKRAWLPRLHARKECSH